MSDPNTIPKPAVAEHWMISKAARLGPTHSGVGSRQTPTSTFEPEDYFLLFFFHFIMNALSQTLGNSTHSSPSTVVD